MPRSLVRSETELVEASHMKARDFPLLSTFNWKLKILLTFSQIGYF